MRRLAMTAATVAAALTLAACGGGPSSPTTAPASSMPAMTTAPAANEERNNSAGVMWRDVRPDDDPAPRAGHRDGQTRCDAGRQFGGETLAAQIEPAQEPEITEMTG